MLYINQLHLFTVMTLTGKVQLVEKDGDKQVVVQEGKAGKTESCTDTERKRVQDQIMAYINQRLPLPRRQDCRAAPKPTRHRRSSLERRGDPRVGPGDADRSMRWALTPAPAFAL